MVGRFLLSGESSGMIDPFFVRRGAVARERTLPDPGIHEEAPMRRTAVLLSIGFLLLLPVQVAATGMMEHLAGKIVHRNDSPDMKMQKIERWVQDNVEYVSDSDLYGKNHVHYHPSVTIRKRKADCEDGALLIHSLAAYAGIPMERVRTVMGSRDTQGKQGGHAWTLYRREEDHAWIVVDWTRRRDAGPMGGRPFFWLTRGYGEFKIRAYLVVERLRPYRVGYVEIKGDAPVSRLGVPGELDRLLGTPVIQ